MKRVLVNALALLVAVAFMVSSGVGASDRGGNKDLDVSATLDFVDGYPRVVFAITNRGNVEVDVRRETIWRGNMILLVVEERTGSILKEDRFPDDIPAGTWTLRPGGSAVAELDLRSRFPQLPAAIQNGPVILFWTFSPRYANEGPGRRVGGFLVLK
jgi:hypothetical protein